MDLEMREIDRGGAEQFKAGGDDPTNPETAIAIGDDEAAEDVREDGAARTEGGDDDQRRSSSCIIDINGEGLSGENQRVCRICHLSAKESGKSSTELIELGCGCKGELGVAHSHCAEAWFRVRGNRLCEICGATAKNITGVSDTGFMEEWNESGTANAFTSSSDGRRRCLRGQPLCNFLMACLVIAFVLPWFFRVNMF